MKHIRLLALAALSVGLLTGCNAPVVSPVPDEGDDEHGEPTTGPGEDDAMHIELSDAPILV